MGRHIRTSEGLQAGNIGTVSIQTNRAVVGSPCHVVDRHDKASAERTTVKRTETTRCCRQDGTIE